jgi:hypothetical protein
VTWGLLGPVERADEEHGDDEEGDGGEGEGEIGHGEPHLVGRGKWLRAISWQRASHSGNWRMNSTCATHRFSSASSLGPAPQRRRNSAKAFSYTSRRSEGSIRSMARRSAPELQMNAAANAAAKITARAYPARLRNHPGCPLLGRGEVSMPTGRAGGVPRRHPRILALAMAAPGGDCTLQGRSRSRVAARNPNDVAEGGPLTGSAWTVNPVGGGDGAGPRSRDARMATGVPERSRQFA